MPSEMKNRRLFPLLLRFSLFFSLLFSFSCKKETLPHYPQISIQLKVTDVLNGTQLDWSKVETSDFINYTVVRSFKDSIPDFANLSQNPNAEVIIRSSDAKNPSFTDEKTNFGNIDRTYYRVFVQLEGRTLASPNVLTNLDVEQLYSPFDYVISNNSKETPRFHLASYNKKECAIYDVQSDSIIAKGALPFDNLIYMNRAIASKNGQNEEIATTVLDNRIAFNDAKTGHALTTYHLNVQTTPLAICGTSDGFFILITSEAVNNVKCISVGTHTILSQMTVNLGFSPYLGSVLVKNPADREFILRDPYGVTTAATRIMRFRYSEQGQISEVKTGTVSNLSGAKKLTRTPPTLNISADGNLFIVNNSLLNRSFDVQKSIVNSLTADYIYFAFNADGDKLYAASGNDTNQLFGGTTIDEYTFPSLKKLRTIPTKVAVERFFIANDKIYVFNNSFVQKIKL
jgi:hypothetical protein